MLREEFRFQCSIHPRTPKPAHMPSFADPRRNSFTNITPSFRFSGSRGPPIAPRSPRSFLADGAVGLGIVPAIAADPEAVAIARADTVSEWGEKPPEETALCESYTCVRSYMGGRPVSKRIYYGDGDGGIVGEFRGDKIALFELQPPLPAEPAFHVAKLFGRCFRCRMELDGLDIYVYRGDKAFCSMECRCQQMVIDELTEKFTKGSKRKHESSMSPCTAPSLFAAKAIKDYKV